MFLNNVKCEDRKIDKYNAENYITLYAKEKWKALIVLII